MYFLRLFALSAAAILWAQTPPPQGAPAQHNINVDVQRVPDSELLASKPLTPEEAAKVVMVIGDTEITAGEFMAYIDTVPPQYRQQARTVNRGKWAQEVIKIKFLAAEARRQKVDQDPKVQAQLNFQAENLLAARAYDRRIQGLTVDEAALRDYFSKHKAEYERVKASHILVRLPGSPVPLRKGQKELTSDEALAKAQALRKRIVAGEDFAKLAKEESDDTNSAASGGDVGFFKRGQMVPEFEEVAFFMKPGEVSEPVRSQYGFHVIRLDQREAKSFEELKPELEKRVRLDLAQKALLENLSKGAVKVDETFFGPLEFGAPMAQAPAAPVK
jgi:peptidyl-prolyl cis-trans isomerase C